jgi:hypothetical protein
MLIAPSMCPPLNSKSYRASTIVNLRPSAESCRLRGQEAPARKADGSAVEGQSRGGSTLLPPRNIEASVCADSALRPSRDRLKNRNERPPEPLDR